VKTSISGRMAATGAMETRIMSIAPICACSIIFRDEDHMHKVIDGDIGKQIGDKLTANPKSRLVFLAG
jgi:TRAP-type C4-dicarboxylate transport system substrate-binding protein